MGVAEGFLGNGVLSRPVVAAHRVPNNQALGLDVTAFAVVNRGLCGGGEAVKVGVGGRLITVKHVTNVIKCVANRSKSPIRIPTPV